MSGGEHDDVTYDALIIGAGPAGTSVAHLLARGGWSVAVVEKKNFPRRKVCGEFISATSLPLLRELRIGEAFLEAAGPEVRRVGLFARDTVLAADMPQSSDSSARWGRALGREHLDLLLLAAAKRAGADVWQPWTAAEVLRTSTGYTCAIVSRDCEKFLTARVVIIAHGSWEHSALLRRGFNAHGPSDLLAFKAHFRDCDLSDDLMPLFLFPGGYGGMVQSDGGRVSLSCCIRRDELQRCRQRLRAHAGDAVLRHIRSSCLGVRETLKRSHLDGAWLSAGPINTGISSCYANGVFFVGNTAGEAHPIVAEGISMALQSGRMLARHLIGRQDEAVASRGLSEIGLAYGRDWKASFALRVRAAATFAHLTMQPGSAAVYLPILKQFPGILTLAANLSGKTAQMDQA
jgi:menaquinone-9 beta-reductase